MEQLSPRDSTAKLVQNNTNKMIAIIMRMMRKMRKMMAIILL